MIWRIREVLGLQAKTGAMRARFPVFASSDAIEEVAAIKLDAWFGGQHIQDSPAGSFEYFGGHLQAASFALFKHPIVIEPFSPLTHTVTTGACQQFSRESR